MSNNDWRTELEKRRQRREGNNMPLVLTPDERRQIDKVQQVLRKQVNDAAAAIDEAIFNPELLPGGHVLPADSPLRGLEVDLSGYDLVLRGDSLAAQMRQGTEFWTAAHTVAFADEDPDLDPIGALHFTQILDAFRAIFLSSAFACNAQSNIACMQQGKSGSASAKYIFHPLVRWVVFRQKLHSFYLLPNLLGLAEQILREFSAKYQLFSPFRLKHPDTCPQGVSVRELFSEVLKPHWEIWDPSHPRQHIIRVTRKRSIQDKYHAKLTQMQAQDELVQVLIDESDAASERSGVLDGMIGQFVNKVIQGEVPRCLLFLHTATPQEHQWSNNFVNVLEHQGAVYRGFPLCEGEPFPNRDSVPSRSPLVLPYADYFGIDELDFRSYKCPLAWLKNVQGIRKRGKKGYERYWRRRQEDLDPVWQQFRRCFEERLATMALRLLEEKQVLGEDGEVEPFPHARGVVVRPIDKNYDQGSADELAQALERIIDERDQEVKVVRFYGENARRTAKELIRAEAAGHDYIVLVTGKARRGDAFPKHCAFAIDLTPRPSTLIAALQGLFGRMCGWGKKTAFFGSRPACDIIRLYGRQGVAADVVGLTAVGYRVETESAGVKRRLSKAGDGFTVAELLRDRVEDYVAEHPDAQPVLTWMDDLQERLNHQKEEGRTWNRAIVAGHRKRGKGSNRYSVTDENCREFLASFDAFKVAEVIERHPSLCCTTPDGALAFSEVRLLHCHPDPEVRRQLLEVFREHGTPSEYISTAGMSNGSYYGDHVGRREVPTTTRHTMGKATTYHGRKGHAASEDHYTVQLWWTYQENDNQAGRVLVPRITLVLRDRHAAHTAQVDEAHRPLRTKPESIYSNEVIVGAGGE